MALFLMDRHPVSVDKIADDAQREGHLLPQ